MKQNSQIFIMFLIIQFLIFNISVKAQVISGFGHSLCLCDNSTVKATGVNATGQLGDNTLINKSTPISVKDITGLDSLTNIIEVAAGEQHSLALRNDSTVLAWGRNNYGQLGDSTQTNRLIPVQVRGSNGIDSLTDIISIAVYDGYSMALRSDSTIWTWGENAAGQLGIGNTTTQLTPVQVKGPGGVGYITDAIAIACGRDCSMAIRSDSTVWTWGDDYWHQLGDGNATTRGFRTTPGQVVGPGGFGFLDSIIAIDGGWVHSAALKSDGTVWSWGYNWPSVMANSSCFACPSPVQALGPGGIGFLNNITAIGVGISHSMVLKNDGTVWAWGSNSYGALGDSTTTTRSTPVQVRGTNGVDSLTNIVAIDGGAFHSMALRDDSTVWVWGLNSYGQLGNGTTNDALTPIQMNISCDISISLPIILLSFDAYLLSNKTVLCKWTTETEINNDYFTVEKSPSAFGISTKGREGWEFVAKVDGAGNSSVPLDYSAIDPNPYQGISYYRLKQTDFNGNYTYSDLRAINLQGIDIIQLSPNPAEKEIAVLLYSTEKTKVNTAIYNILGQKVFEQQQIAVAEGTNRMELDISSFSTGYYMLEMVTASGLYRVQKKLVKN